MMANNTSRLKRYSKIDITGHRIKTGVHRQTSKQYISPFDLKRILKTIMLKKNVYRTKLKKISYRTEQSKSIYFFFESNSDMSNLLGGCHSSYTVFKDYTKNDKVEGRVELKTLYQVKGDEMEKFFDVFSNETASDNGKERTHYDTETHKPLKTYQFTSTPVIRPFLSDRHITQLQTIQEECRVESEQHQQAEKDAATMEKEKEEKGPLSRTEENTDKDQQEVTIKDKQETAEDTQALRSKADATKVSSKKQATKPGAKSKTGRSAASKSLKQRTLSEQEKTKKQKTLDGDKRDITALKKSLGSEKSEKITKKKSKSSRSSRESSKERKALKEDEKSLSKSSSKKLKSAQSSKLTLGSKKSKESQKPSSKGSSKKASAASDTSDEEKLAKGKSAKKKGQATLSDSDSEHQETERSTRAGSPGSKEKKQVRSRQKRTSDRTSTYNKAPTAATADSRRAVTFRDEVDEKVRHRTLIRSLLTSIYYQLSDCKFIVLGWTLQPKDKDMSRIVTFKTVPAHPRTYCFRDREVVEKRCYPDGKLGATFHPDGTGQVLYYSGEPAMLFTESSLGRRVTVWSESRDDVTGKIKGTVIGVFDSYGNGVVYDEHGNIRLTYDQAEGILYDTPINIPYKWQWNSYKIMQEKRMVALLNSILLKDNMSGGKRTPAKRMSAAKQNQSQTMIATDQYLEDLAELPYPQPPKLKQSHEQNTVFRPIILKLSNHITLRITAQDNVVLTFNANKLLLCLHLGVIVQPEEKIRIDDMDMGVERNIPCLFEVLQNPTPSLMAIKKQLQSLRKERGKNTRHTGSLHV